MHILTSPRLDSSLQLSCMKLVVAVMLASFQLFAQVNGKEHSMKYPTLYRTLPGTRRPCERRDTPRGWCRAGSSLVKNKRILAGR